MDQDAEPDWDIQRLISFCEQLDQDRQPDVAYFQVFREAVSSDGAQLSVVRHAEYGWFVSVFEVDEFNSINYVAFGESQEGHFVTFPAWYYTLQAPRGFFVTTETILDCVREFCDTGRRADGVNWIRFADLGFELYAGHNL
jgi:hypothetical protein